MNHTCNDYHTANTDYLINTLIHNSNQRDSPNITNLNLTLIAIILLSYNFLKVNIEHCYLIMF